MYIYTYSPINRDEIEKRIAEYKASHEALSNLKQKGFKTVNEAFRSIVKTRISKVQKRIKDYENEIEEAVSLAYTKHIADISTLVNSKSM